MEILNLLINDYPQLIQWIIKEYPVIGSYIIFALSIPTCLNTIVSLWVKLTPWDSDNEWWYRIRNGKLKGLFNFLDRFSLLANKIKK